MKFIVLLILSSFILTLQSQEIEHKHSIHHAFIENKGQWDEKVLFKTRFKGGNLWVEQGKMMFHLQDYSAFQRAHANPNFEGESNFYKQHVVHLNFKGAKKVTEIIKEKPTEAYYNFFHGKEERNWKGGVHGYSEATLKQLYQGIDLKLIEENEELKYEFHVAPNIDPNTIQLDIQGQQKIVIDKEGNLNIHTPLGIIREKKPFAYQILNGNIREVSCDFKLKNGLVVFQLGNYNKNVELIIDPTLVFATYSGSVTDNFGMTATYGYDGTAFSGGTIYGNSYPTPDPNALNVTSNFTVVNVFNSVTTDVFVSKYAADGTTMLWTTFFGGGDNTKGTETIHSLICDKQNNLYMYGATSSTDIPIQNGFQPVHGGGTTLNISYNGANFDNAGVDIFVAKISANGHQLLASTYVGGSENDGVNYNLYGGNYPAALYDSLTSNYGDQFRGEIMLDALGNCIIASSSRSSNFPVLNAIQPTKDGLQDGVIFKLNPDFSALIFSTFIGGSNNDACYSVKIDSSYNIVFSGGTSSTNLPTTLGVWQPAYQGGKADGFVGKLNPSGTLLTHLSYVGTNNYDQAFFVEIDRSDNVFLLGQSRGGLFPVTNATYSVPGSSQFIAKLSSDLSTLENSTVFGNGNPGLNISPSAFLVDFCGNIYVSGWGANILQNSPLSGMQVTNDAFQFSSPNGFDFYLMVVDRTFSNLLYGTYLGGSSAKEHVDGGTSRFDKNGVVYQSVCGGCGGFSDFPTTPGAWSNLNLSSNCNNILFKFDFGITPKAEFTSNIVSGCAPLTITFNNTSTVTDSYQWHFGDGFVDSINFNPSRTFTTPGTYTVTLLVSDSICQITDSALITIQVFDSLVIDLPAVLELCQPIPITLTGNTFGTATQFQWSSNNQFTDQLNTSLADSTLTITPTISTVYYFKASNPYCSLYDSIAVNFISSGLELTGQTGICIFDSTIITVTNSNPTVNFTYVWSPTSIIANYPSTTSVTVKPESTQYIYVTASTQDGCIIKDSILINVSLLGNINAEASASKYSIMEGETVTLFGQPSGYSYQWQPANLVNSPTSQNTSATIANTQLFTLTVSDGICAKSDTVMVKTIPFVCDHPFIFIPNAFSPNGDGDNDLLYVRSAVTTDILFRVFDRWGEMVFESTSLHIGWDGKYKGKNLAPDVYDYYLKATCINGESSILKGNVTLLK
ncbi:MAG: gliding motility-associated C-terminal domain-containing protein [Crocinitomicaceae bacterium]|nr:gliding motility-associated C-terminal domain-containing protein [Crocinitomicaceae bacterium]